MISIDGMDFSYHKTHLFDQLSLEMGKGKIYGLLGLNGAGKTSLLKLICGLLFAERGKIQVLGKDPRQRSPELLSQIFVLPEELNMPSISAGEYLLARAAFYPDFDHAAFVRYIEEFELPQSIVDSAKRKKIAAQKLSKLSYGQKKKFLLSFGLACCSKLFILDEPSNGMDIPSKGLFRRLLAETLSKEQTFIISTHQVRDIDSLLDSVVVLHQGQTLFVESMAEISRRIEMKRSDRAPDPDAAGLLYSELGLGGYWSVWRREQAGEDSGPFDLEILFNSVISKPEMYKEIFSPGAKTGGATS